MPPSAPPAVQEVFAACAPLVWRTLRRLGFGEADVEELAQEVFVVVHRKLPGFEGRAKVTTWVYGICVRVASDHRRRAHVRYETSLDAAPEPAAEATQDAAMAQADARRALDRALAALDDDKRVVFVLYEIEELPMADVAEAVGVPLQTAYSRLHAARRQLADALGRRTGGAA